MSHVTDGLSPVYETVITYSVNYLLAVQSVNANLRIAMVHRGAGEGPKITSRVQGLISIHKVYGLAKRTLKLEQMTCDRRPLICKIGRDAEFC